MTDILGAIGPEYDESDLPNIIEMQLHELETACCNHKALYSHCNITACEGPHGEKGYYCTTC